MKINNKKLYRWSIIVLVVLLLFTALLVDSNARLTVTLYDVNSANLPEGFEGYRIVQLTDLHGAVFGKDNSRLIEKIRDQRPDMIALTGDIFDEDTDEGYAASLCRQLIMIAPVYYVTGNHEWVLRSKLSPILEELESIGVKVLQNEYEKINRKGSTVVIAGAEDPNGSADMMTKQELCAKIKSETSDYIVMLSHRNSDFDLWTGEAVDLVLCGHAHGGVIRLPLIGGILVHREDWKRRQIGGCYTEGKTSMVVSRGLGNTGEILRINNNPEIVVVELHSSARWANNN